MLNNPNDKLPNHGAGFRIPGGFILLLLIIGVIFLINLSMPGTSAISEIPYTDFLRYLNQNQIESVIIRDNSVMDIYLKGAGNGTAQLRTRIPYSDPGLLSFLQENNINISGAVTRPGFWQLVREFLPWVIGFALVIFLVRSLQGMGARNFQFGKSRAKQFQGEGKKVSFADVAGQKDAKYELEEIVEFLKNPQKFTKMGARIPRGVLLVGMPGTGKTLMARSVAGEAGVPFFHMSGSDFVEMFVGVGASRVRDLFVQGRRHSPCIIFIDELDAVGRTRGAGYGGGHDEREQTLNQLLVEMDGFDSKDHVIILAATNRPDVLDPALLRPGRFDRQVVIAMPDIKEREAILQIHSAKIPMGKDIDLSRIARATPGMSGADIANLANEAALFAARKNRKEVQMADFEEARDKILMGVARSTLVISEKERKMTALHEAGHALLHYYLKNADPLHKVTIIPRGRALAMALSLPEEDIYSRSRGWIEDRIAICYGGWLAEKIFYNETTTGAKNDIQQATEMARNMVCEWGMSSDIGPIAYGKEDEPIFIGKEIARHKDYSDDTARRIDEAVIKILDQTRGRAEAILMEHKENVEKLADELLVRETLVDDEVREIIGLKKGEAA
ncbi:MAG: ATP-dependent zinc metalloprotease FtsH [Treponema sp.]|jgi:cell division protease FtsH|nr:ATP-dependent zinc metalloprotease FtsH [Treponema sp.]